MRLSALITLSLLWNSSNLLSQPIVKIGGHPDQIAMERQVLWYLDQLNIEENIHLTIIFTSIIPEGFDGLTVSRNVLEEDGYQILMVRISNKLSEAQQQTVLAHEMIHVKQYAKGELQLIEYNKVVWLGKRLNLGMVHHKGPWEKEAFREDRTLAIAFREDRTLAIAFQKRPIVRLAAHKQSADSIVFYMSEKLP